jgi:hypothetical protein
VLIADSCGKAADVRRLVRTCAIRRTDGRRLAPLASLAAEPFAAEAIRPETLLRRLGSLRRFRRFGRLPTVIVAPAVRRTENMTARVRPAHCRSVVVIPAISAETVFS